MWPFSRRSRIGAASAVALACVIALTVLFVPRGKGDSPEPEPTPLLNKDRTMDLGGDGLVIDLVDAAGSTAESWSSGTTIEPAPEFSLTSEGVVVPEQSSEFGALWLLLQDPGDPDGVTSLVDINRKGDGSLNEMQLRLWQHKAEFVWVSDVERKWTVSWDGGPLQPLTGTSFTHHERTEKSRTYEFVGTLAEDDPPEGTSDEMIFVRRIPGTAELSIPEAGGAPAKLTSASGAKATFVEWNSFIEDERIEVPTECTDALDFGTYAGDGREFASGAAEEAFTETGRPRSRISTRVGAGFSPTDPELNARVFDEWLYRGIGVTQEYLPDALGGHLSREAWAGRSGLSLESSVSGPTRALRSVVTAESDPLCKILFWDAPNIDVDYTAIMEDDGGIEVLALFDKVPSHEVLWETTENPDGSGERDSGCIYYRDQSWFYLLPLPDDWKVTFDLRFADVSELPHDCPIENADEG